ncbi:hydrolase, P-loop family [[Clostridium] methylpentosum DSM 5476]|jgi:tRNA threonylcarbamoyladenosine biosynthesis protein TsaE|uniref:tRNA threonylcarbamoyladenosine biosynthesis protein TsaE n=1 Tax=[Clostridium] methylpentosum DSM 5476 TaxID=537013 RepID=C0E9L9_9FIRM|nr:hydrolase, P-loop family [[Clostridium] methylpentosum DSM 5476]MDY3990127.1 tRNA (adenosine(37)-N6)-threonylcarbamoyltransferase complex ATPase subunit type 1 TsaE [Massilioclostridium sp.]MEE1490901.1 tRNA (adenosine(37)-N6)-threonylcarbamoyltransferase complex ATPase subunit type 1 TsaE [Massilioclostridium sp.]
MRHYHSTSAQQTEQIAAQLAKELRGGDVLAFRGGLGAGKTAFVRGLAEGLGVTGEVASPTFSLVNEYRGNPPLYHFDMYRISTMDDLYFTGFFDYLENGSILAIEWSENISDWLPDGVITVTINRLGDEEREILIDGGDRF